MAPATSATREPSVQSPAHENRTRHATDDEILGLDPARKLRPRVDAAPAPSAPTESSRPASHVGSAATAEGNLQDAAEAAAADSASPAPEANDSPEIHAALDAHPALRRAWDERDAFRESFATPEEARSATALLADLDRMDALFFSRRPEDHAELAAAIADLDPAAFSSLAQAIARQAAAASSIAGHPAAGSNATHTTASVRAGLRPAPTADNNIQHAAEAASAQARNDSSPLPSTVIPSEAKNLSSVPTQAQAEFFHATNASAVEGVLSAIESQVDKLLPEGVSKNARNRVVGEIYRELDTTLRSNRQLAQQMRQAFGSGALDADHQRAVVSIVLGRARQALPAVAKRVLNEWTSTIVAANQDRRNRQRAAERRVDIAGSGGASGDGRRSMSPREIDYSRMSDADILNL